MLRFDSFFHTGPPGGPPGPAAPDRSRFRYLPFREERTGPGQVVRSVPVRCSGGPGQYDNEPREEKGAYIIVTPVKCPELNR